MSGPDAPAGGCPPEAGSTGDPAAPAHPADLTRPAPLARCLLSLALLALSVGCGRGGGEDPFAIARDTGLDWKQAAAAEPALAGWPAPSQDGPACVTAQFAVASLSPSSGFPMTGGSPWLTAVDGAFEAPLTLTGGPVTFRLRLKSIRQVGDWPEVRFLLDGREIARQKLDGNEPDTFAAENFLSPRYRWIEAIARAEAAPGPAHLRVEYFCSHSDPVERMGIRGILFDRLFVEQRPPAAACPPASALPTGRKVLLVGLDGASWRVLLPLVNRGLLPNLGRLIGEGCYGPLDSDPMTYSPAIWNSIYTGQPRAAHGIDQMTEKTAQSKEPVPHRSSELKAATLWQMASASGRSVLVVGMNTSWPAQRVRGVVVSDRLIGGTVAPGGGGVWPPSQDEPVRKALERIGTDASLVPKDLAKGLKATAHRDAQAVALARVYLATGQPDLTAVYITLPDPAGHLLWKEHAPFGVEHRFPEATALIQSARERRAAGSGESLDALDRAMVFADELVGRLLSAVDPATAVLVVSDHSTDVADPATSTRYRIGPLLKAVAGDLAYTPYEESWIVSHMFLNLRGREAGGIVAPEEADGEIRRLADVLSALTTGSGRKVFDAVAVHPPRSATGGSSQPADIVGIVNGRIDSADTILLPGGASLPASEIVHPLPERTGTHDRFGIIALAGGGIRRGGLVPYASILDVAPTALALLGLPAAADMPGRPVAEALTGDRTPPCWIPSWRTLAAPTPPPAGGTTPMSQEEMDRLRGLGYVQ